MPLGDGFFAFIECIELDDCDPISSISNKQNWEVSLGTDHDDIDLEALCIEHCDFDCNDSIVMNLDTLEACIHTGCIYPTADFQTITDFTVNGESLSGNPLFDFPYCMWVYCSDTGCPLGTCAIPNLAEDLENYFNSIEVEVFDIDITTPRGYFLF